VQPVGRLPAFALRRPTRQQQIDARTLPLVILHCVGVFFRFYLRQTSIHFHEGFMTDSCSLFQTRSDPMSDQEDAHPIANPGTVVVVRAGQKRRKYSAAEKVQILDFAKDRKSDRKASIAFGVDRASIRAWRVKEVEIRRQAYVPETIRTEYYCHILAQPVV
jgi:hypothetical protein